MSTLHSAIARALTSHFVSEWATAGRTEAIYHDNVNPPPPPATSVAWLRFSVLPATTSHVVLTGGDGGEEYAGQAVAQLFVPLGSGMQLIEAMAEAAVAALRRRRLPVGSDAALDTGEPSVVAVGNAGDDVWYQRNVFAPYDLLRV